jgi:hypothetical protein
MLYPWKFSNARCGDLVVEILYIFSRVSLASAKGPTSLPFCIYLSANFFIYPALNILTGPLQVSRLLALTLILSTVDHSDPLALHLDKNLSLNHWASYFHQASISTSLDTLYQCALNKITPQVRFSLFLCFFSCFFSKIFLFSKLSIFMLSGQGWSHG